MTAPKKTGTRATKAAQLKSGRAHKRQVPKPPTPPTLDEPIPAPEVTEGFFERIERHRREHVPKSGFNLVGMDAFEMPGEELYLIAHFATREEAMFRMSSRPRRILNGLVRRELRCIRGRMKGTLLIKMYGT